MSRLISTTAQRTVQLFEFWGCPDSYRVLGTAVIPWVSESLCAHFSRNLLRARHGHSRLIKSVAPYILQTSLAISISLPLHLYKLTLLLQVPYSLSLSPPLPASILLATKTTTITYSFIYKIQYLTNAKKKRNENGSLSPWPRTYDALFRKSWHSRISGSTQVSNEHVRLLSLSPPHSTPLQYQQLTKQNKLPGSSPGQPKTSA